MSKRKRTAKVLEEPIEKPKTTCKSWSHEDKINLLKGLKTYGHTDLDNLSVLLPNKSKPAIKLKIHKIMQKAKTVTYKKCPALNTWLESGTFDDKSRPIPQMLKFISLFEKHPNPDECGGFDFKAAYNYLHRMTLGLPPMDLPPGNLNNIFALMEELEKKVWPEIDKEIVGYLGTLDKKETAQKCYPPMNKLKPIKTDFWPNLEGGSTD